MASKQNSGCATVIATVVFSTFVASWVGFTGTLGIVFALRMTGVIP